MKVAIIIPTLNRRDFVERAVGYYNSLNSPHPIYLGDASDPDYAAQTAYMLKRFKNVEVKYFNWRGLDGSRTFAKLVEEAGKECQFCAYSGDDDYLVPLSLTRCAEFLAENEDYRTAQGRAAIFTLDCPGAYGEIGGLEEYWGENSLEQETGLERLQYFQGKYYGTQFSVHRIEELLDDSKYFMRLKNWLLGELIHCFTFAVRGKSKFIDCLYLIRNVEPDRQNASLVDWIMRPTWSLDIETFINGLSLPLHEIDDMPLSRAREIVTEILHKHFYLSSLKGVLHLTNGSFRSRLKRFMPTGVINAYRQLKILTADDCDMRLLRSKKSRFYEDFLPVSNSLNKNLSSKD